jgi:predicted ABC-type ATPase
MANERPSFWIINPDFLTRQLQERESPSLQNANLQGVTRIEAWLDASIAVYQTIGVETVLSTGKCRRLVTEVNRRGFAFRLIFVMLESVELGIERVRIRVEEGGHDGPEDRIRSRRGRSFEQLPWFLEEVEQAAL